MDKQSEYEITSNIFGGYNKKQAKEYIDELCSSQQALQEELLQVRGENQQLKDKLDEVKSCYRALWERCKTQEESLKHQHDMLMEFAKHTEKAEKAEKQIIYVKEPVSEKSKLSEAKKFVDTWKRKITEKR